MSILYRVSEVDNVEKQDEPQISQYIGIVLKENLKWPDRSHTSDNVKNNYE